MNEVREGERCSRGRRIIGIEGTSGSWTVAEDDIPYDILEELLDGDAEVDRFPSFTCGDEMTLDKATDVSRDDVGLELLYLAWGEELVDV